MPDDPHAVISQAAASLGMAPPPLPFIVDASGIIRYHDHINDRNDQKNGWYKAFSNPDGTIGGAVGSWKLGRSTTFCTSATRTFSAEERTRFAQEQARKRAGAEAEQRRRQEAAEKRAATTWGRSTPADAGHPYFVRKGIKPHRARQIGGSLVLDYRDIDGKLTTLQFIDADGGKRFLTDGAVKGCFHRFGGKVIDTVLLAEGFATGATLHEATGHPVCVCGSAGNLAPVALAVRELFPTITIIVGGDADPVGRKAATDAAELVGGVLCLPDFGGQGGEYGY